jgi:hypothetical protein
MNIILISNSKLQESLNSRNLNLNSSHSDNFKSLIDKIINLQILYSTKPQGDRHAFSERPFGFRCSKSSELFIKTRERGYKIALSLLHAIHSSFAIISSRHLALWLTLHQSFVAVGLAAFKK